ncbi:MAG: prolipoprotein diacylglyceryl transferase [Deltaproteobacteria bacterium]|nr:prolipoprotein diacylglyceryl transferase [Deltaproteobacteria bacterium]
MIRFFVEYFKAYHVMETAFPLTMGQMLSVPFILAGWVMIIHTLRIHKRSPNRY